MWETLLLICVVVLLGSNVWLLKEIDRLQGRLEHHVAEVRLLGDRLYRLSMDVSELDEVYRERSSSGRG